MATDDKCGDLCAPYRIVRELPQPGQVTREIPAEKNGPVKAIYNGVIARIARLAVHVQSERSLEFALKFLEEHRDGVDVG